MRKTAIIVLAALLLLAAGTMAFANTNGEGFGSFSFEQMLPFMQQMHPNWTTPELQSMFDDCHGAGGRAATDGNYLQPQNMMGF